MLKRIGKPFLLLLLFEDRGHSLADNIKMNLREIGYENWRRTELAKDRVHWRALISVMLNFRVLLPDLVS